MSDETRNTDEGTMDLAIDRAVRELLDVEPPAGLRARVMARIEEPHVASAFHPSHVASAFRRKIWVIGVPIAAAAMVLLAVVIARREAGGPETVMRTPPSIAQGNPAAPSPSSPRIEPPAAAAPTTIVARDVPREPRGVSAVPAVAAGRGLAVAATLPAPGDPAAGAISPLAPIDPIAVAAIRPSDITPAAIDVGPLKPIAAIQVAPLTPPEGRN